MSNFIKLLFITSSLLLLVPSLCVTIHHFTSCLTRHQIHNFTTKSDFPTYSRLLNFSIQNLRFTAPQIAKPLAIVLPGTAEELGKSVMCCREALVEMRVRCGGHSYEGTSWVANDGVPFVIIDMMKLNSVSVEVESETAWVQGGATLGETYAAIAEASKDHGFSAGSCPTVGVGGHIGGGGFGLLSRKYGVAADNVVDALLVDANGRLLDRKGMGEDVFWAIRGGGGGAWGIVYAWKIKLLKLPNTVTGFVISRGGGGGSGSKNDVAKLVNKWQSIAPSLSDDFYLSCFLGAGLPQAKSVGISATFKGFFLGTGAEVVSVLHQVFPELGVVEKDCKEMSWIESVLFFSGLGDRSSVSDLRNRYLADKHSFKAKSDYVRSRISEAGIDVALDILEEEAKGYVILDPYGGMMNEIRSEAIAFPHREGNLYTIQYLVEWREEDDENTREYMNWIRRFYKAMAPFVSRGPRAAYINYMDLDIGKMANHPYNPGWDAVEMARIWGEKYFLKNFDRLVRAKTFIDPDNVFRNQQSIPPNPNPNPNPNSIPNSCPVDLKADM